MNDTILVTGATGTVGREVIHHLLAGGRPVRALTRRPEAADLPDGVEVVGGDLDDPATLHDALRGAAAVHLISVGSAGPVADPDGLASALRDAGVTRCTVLVDWDDEALVPALVGAGLTPTYLMPVEFMHNKLGDWAATVRAGDAVFEITDRPSPLVHETDIGAVAAAALTQGDLAGRHLALTGPEALRPSEQVAVIAEVTGRPVAFEQVDADEAARRWRAAGRDEAIIAFGIELAAFDPGEYAEVHPTVEQVLGRPATGFRTWVEAHADAFHRR